MLFSNPDYPVFLIAVFLLYGLSRFGGAVGTRIARACVMVLLGDVVFLLLAKDPDQLWDPLGGLLLHDLKSFDLRVLVPRATIGFPSIDHVAWSTLAWHWLVGLGVVGLALWFGVRGSWLGSERGRRWIARGLVAVIVVIAAAVGLTWYFDVLDELSFGFQCDGHLLVLALFGIGIGAAQVAEYRPLGRVVILFVVSSLFYQAWACTMSGPYCYLLGALLLTIVLDYYLALWIEAATTEIAKRALVIVSLLSNLGILGFFKYSDFLRIDVLRLDVDPWNLILPAGISFHTFQSLSYTIDVYRGRLRATRSPLDFATFVLFFPQLVAGPIARAEDLLPQIGALPGLDLAKATDGVFRIVVGLFKKIALADTLGVSIVERVFDAPGQFSSVEVLAGIYGWALQIYLDFSAYSDIAIGSAQVLGFDLPENFRTPYRSRNLQEFWRRWHISLSTWLRDYLYVTLGGNRGAPWRTYVNLLLTMLLGGLWHGASWTFVVWGALHGFGLAVTRYFQRATSSNARAALELLVGCAIIAVVGIVVEVTLFPAGTGTWTYLVVSWVALMPLWAVLTAWLGRESADDVVDPPLIGVAWRRPFRARLDRALAVELVRIAMCGAGIAFLIALPVVR